MERRLRSNFKYVWWDLVTSLILVIFMPIGVVAGWINMESLGQFLAILIFLLLFFALGIFGLVRFLLDWQWVTVYADRISVRCVLFEIRSIPIEKIKRCWVCSVMMSYIRGWRFYRDFLVIDTAKTRKKHTIPEGFSSRKHRYIILPDTLESRAALRSVELAVE